MARPMISRPPPRRRHRDVEMTALVSSANHWPRRGGPSCRASAGVTAAPGTNCGSPGAVRRISAGAEPAEHVEARGLLLVVLQLGDRHQIERARAGRVHAVQRHEALAVRVRQRPQQHAVDDGEDRRGRADPDGKRDHCEQRDAGRRFPGGPGLGEGRQHVAVTLARSRTALQPAADCQHALLPTCDPARCHWLSVMSESKFSSWKLQPAVGLEPPDYSS